MDVGSLASHMPRIFDAVILAIVLEVVALAALKARGIGPGAMPLLANIGAGFFLVLAGRLALSGAGVAMTGMCLLAALASHLTDLRRRWRSP